MRGKRVVIPKPDWELGQDMGGAPERIPVDAVDKESRVGVLPLAL